ncbi:hypothetical protein MRB53_005783 [Persea americana]|uniref:Uncharacterized protein n=1 Tax=Persea americana TaxID=3435 RepID=A0ACC2MED4_PERAE|nr:hypothetical protein MRB53_005783 [Persea americana]
MESEGGAQAENVMDLAGERESGRLISYTYATFPSMEPVNCFEKVNERVTSKEQESSADPPMEGDMDIDIGEVLEEMPRRPARRIGASAQMTGGRGCPCQFFDRRPPTANRV